MSWKPIKTAPRDKTVLIYVVGSELNDTFQGQGGVYPAYIDEDGIALDITRWKEPHDTMYWTVTHWHAFPEPPQSPSEQKGTDDGND